MSELLTPPQGLLIPHIEGLKVPKEEIPKEYSLYIPNAIDDAQTRELIKSLDAVALTNPEAPIEMVIDTYGGGINAALELNDWLHHAPNPIKTQARSKCYSAGILLVSGGTVGLRSAWDEADFIMHQAQYTIKDWHGSAPDFFNYAKDMLRTNRRFMRALSENTGTDVGDLLAHTQRDWNFGSRQAQELGIIDNILPRVRQ